MKAVTRKFSSNGAYVESSNTLNIGRIAAASSKTPQIIALSVEDVATVSGISLEIVSSQNVGISQGFFKYYTSKDILTSFDNIDKQTASLDVKIPLRNLGNTTSEYIYIWIDPSKITYRGDVFVRLKWSFDYIEPSSSSCSSSSCSYGNFTIVNAYEEKRIHAEDCEYVYLKLNLDPEQYATVFFDGEALSFENNGGTLVVCDEFFFENDTTKTITVDEHQYSVKMIDATEFFIRIYREGQCSPLDHLILTTGDDFLLETGFRVLLLGERLHIKGYLVQTTGMDFLLTDGGRLLLVDESSSSSSSCSCSSSSSST